MNSFNLRKTFFNVFTSAILFSSIQAYADSTFRLEWSGASFGNTATAVGSITFNPAGLAYLTTANSTSPPTSAIGVTAFTMTINGAGIGNQTLSLANNGGDFTIWSPSPLNLTRQLIGQPVGGGLLYGQTTSTAGDFNYFPVSGTTSRGSWYFTYTAEDGSAMLLTYFGIFGPSVADTQQSLVNTAAVLQGTVTLQNSVMVNSFTYDCPVFDKYGVCVSAGGRNTTVQAQGINNTSGLLIASYRLDANNSRVGAYADQNLSISGPGTVQLGNNTPMLGIFGVWSERPDGVGAEVKVSAAYGQKSTTVTRQVVGTSEAGIGGSNLTSQGAQVIARYGFGVADQLVASPYVGVRYTQNNLGGYTEASSTSVTAPLSYGQLNTNATTALAGAELKYRGIPQTTLFASAGVETDTNTANGSYNASNASIGTLAPVNFNPNPVKTRPTASIGAYYDVEKNQRLGVTGIYRQEPFQAVSTTTVMATYTVGL